MSSPGTLALQIEKPKDTFTLVVRIIITFWTHLVLQWLAVSGALGIFLLWAMGTLADCLLYLQAPILFDFS